MPSPSDDVHAQRDPRLYVDDMLGFCEAALSYTVGFTRAGFEGDRMRFDATLRNIELIGEASTHVPVALKQLAPGIPWRDIVGTRNRLAHGYLGIDNDTVWDIVTVELPRLRIALLALRDHPSIRC